MKPVDYDRWVQIRSSKTRSERRSLVDPSLIWRYFGEFEKIKTVAKFGARIGLLMSSTRHAEFIKDSTWRIEDDIVHHGFNYTDGCGRMSTQLSQRFTRNRFCSYRYQHQDYGVPSVVQIRIMGCKGILLHDPTLDSSLCELVLRESQKKFDWNMKTVKGRLKYRERQCGQSGRMLGICRGGESKPFVYGRLNKQFVLILSALGVSNDSFLDLQNEYFELVKLSKMNRNAAFDVLCMNTKTDEAETISASHKSGANESGYTNEVYDCLESIHNSIFAKRITECEIKKAESIAFTIPIMSSRNMYGAADISHQLNVNECFFQYTEFEAFDVNTSSAIETNKTRRRLVVKSPPDRTRILVLKSPTYYPGDARVLIHRKISALSHLSDVFIFPVNESVKRPHSHEIHESDLDGDEFFVSWDQRLVPTVTEKPMDPIVRAVCHEKHDITKEDLIDRFCKSESHIGLVNKIYNGWAEEVGAGSPECRKLAKVFSEAVDQAKHGGKVNIPSRLRRRQSESDRERPKNPKLIQQVLMRNLLQQPYQHEMSDSLQLVNTNLRRTPTNSEYILVEQSPMTSDMLAMVRYSVWSHSSGSFVRRISRRCSSNHLKSKRTFLVFFRPSSGDPNAKVRHIRLFRRGFLR